MLLSAAPAPDDLAEALEVPLTQEIQDLAAELGRIPVALYEDAITINAFGRGQTVFAGFDLLATAARDGLDSLLARTLLAALEHVHPEALDQTAGSVVPIEVVLRNQGFATPARASIALPPGTPVVDSGTAQTTTTGVQWEVTLAENEERVLPLWLRLPITPGLLTLAGFVEAGVESSSTIVAELSLTLSVLAPQDLDSAFASLDAVLTGDLDVKLRPAFEKARKNLEQPQTVLPDDSARALKEALRAADRLPSVTDNNDVTLVRVMIGLWIKWLGQ